MTSHPVTYILMQRAALSGSIATDWKGCGEGGSDVDPDLKPEPDSHATEVITNK